MQQLRQIISILTLNKLCFKVIVICFMIVEPKGLQKIIKSFYFKIPYMNRLIYPKSWELKIETKSIISLPFESDLHHNIMPSYIIQM